MNVAEALKVLEGYFDHKTGNVPEALAALEDAHVLLEAATTFAFHGEGGLWVARVWSSAGKSVWRTRREDGDGHVREFKTQAEAVADAKMRASGT